MGGMALLVASVSHGGPCSGSVTEGDLLVAVGGRLVTTAQAVEKQLWEAIVKAQASNESSSSTTCGDGHAQTSGAEVSLTLLRRGKVREVSVPVRLIGNDGARRIVCWNGLILQETPRSVHEFGKVPTGVYI